MTLAEFPWPTWLIGAVTVLFWLVCIVMILTVLIQKPQGGGLSGAFGSGAGAGQTAFGTKTGDVLTLFTIIVFVLFTASAAVLGVGSRPLSRDDLLEREERAAERAAQNPPVTPPANPGTPGTTPPGQTTPPDGTTPPAGTTPPVTPPEGPKNETPKPADEPKAPDGAPKTDAPGTEPPKPEQPKSDPLPGTPK